MLDDLWRKLYPKIFKKPCYICLTQAICNNRNPWERTCETKTSWKAQRFAVERQLDRIECFLAVFMLAVFAFLLASTFVLGIWKWCDLVIYWFS